MDSTLVESINGTELVASFVKDSMTVAISNGLSVPSLLHGDDGKSIEDALKDLDDFVESWNLNGYNHHSVGVGYHLGSKWSLTKSETKWLIHAIDTVGYTVDEIERRESPDFVCEGAIGVEVKSDRNYKISRKQLRAMSKLRKSYVYYVTPTRVEALDTFDWIGMDEYETDR